MWGLLAVCVLAIVAAALVVVGVVHAARNDERGVPYHNPVDMAALNAKGIANDERGFCSPEIQHSPPRRRRGSGWRAPL